MTTESYPLPSDADKRRRYTAAPRSPHHATPEEEEHARKREQASLSVMHPDPSDPDWRHYHGAWGG